MAGYLHRAKPNGLVDPIHDGHRHVRYLWCAVTHMRKTPVLHVVGMGVNRIGKVFSTAAIAEVSARDRINWTLSMLPYIRQKLVADGLSVNERLLKELQDAHAGRRIVLRTYLTSAAGYRRHIADGTACDDLKDALLALHLPHFNWVTEIATIDSYNHSSAGMRRIYGHTIIDATSTGKDDDGLLALHLPGLLFTKDIDALGQDQENLELIEGDDLYECRAKNR